MNHFLRSPSVNSIGNMRGVFARRWTKIGVNKSQHNIWKVQTGCMGSCRQCSLVEIDCLFQVVREVLQVIKNKDFFDIVLLVYNFTIAVFCLLKNWKSTFQSGYYRKKTEKLFSNELLIEKIYTKKLNKRK